MAETGFPSRRQRIARVWFFIATGGIILMLFPFVAENLISFDDGGGALMVLGFLIFVTGLVSGFVYRNLGKAEQAILSDPGSVLASWDLDQAEWNSEVRKIFQARKMEMAGTWRLLLIASLFAWIPAAIFTEPLWATGIIVVLLIFLFLFSQAVPHVQRRRLLSSGGRIVISRKGILRGLEFNPFGIAGTEFEEIGWDGEKLRFVYSSISRTGSQDHEIIITVPLRERERVPVILSAFRSS